MSSKKVTSKKVLQLPGATDAPPEESIDDIRARLNVLDQHLWDKCWEALDTSKAMGKWPDFMSKLEELKKKSDLSAASMIEIVFDEVAITEAESA